MMKCNKIIICLLLVIIFIVTIVIYPVIKNDHYQDNIERDIYKNTDIRDISYFNKDNNYYIVKDSDKIYVFDLNYEEVYSIDIKDVKDSDMNLVYRRNNLYYEKKAMKKDSLKYEFYDVKNIELVYEVDLGGK